MNELDRLARPIAALTKWLHDNDLRGAIIGGVAASLRGKPRLTRDIDAIVLDPDIGRLLTTAAHELIVPRVPDVIEFARNTGVLLLRHSPTAVDLDVSIGGLPFEEELVERAQALKVGGMSVPVATAEDLIIMKAVAHRPRDIADIESLIAANPDLDLDRVRRWVREFSSVLEMPEIHDELERLLARRKR